MERPPHSLIAVSKDVPRMCAPTTLALACCVDNFGLSGLLPEVATILSENADIVAIRTEKQ